MGISIYLSNWIKFIPNWTSSTLSHLVYHFLFLLLPSSQVYTELETSATFEISLFLATYLIRCQILSIPFQWLLFHSTAPFKNLHPYGPKSRPVYPQANTLIWNLQFSPCQRVSIETVSPKGTFLKILRGSFNSHKDLGEGSMTGNYRAEARTARHTAVIGTLHEKNYLVFCMTFLQVLSDIDKWKAYPQLPKSVLQNIFAVYLKFSKTVTNR